MKNPILTITTVFLTLFGTLHTQAQDFNPEQNNYLVLSKNIQQLNPVLLTASDLAKEDGKKFGAFYMIICGKKVTEIINNEHFETLLKKAKAQNVTVFVCGISLKKFGIKPSELPNNIEITENAILYGFQLSKKGFIALTI